MKNYKVRVEDANGHVIALRGFTIPDYDFASFPDSSYAAGSSYVALHNEYYTKFHEELYRSVFYFAPANLAITDAYQQTFAPFGFVNNVVLSPSSVGEKFIFKNGSYIEITAFEYVNGNINQPNATFEYKLSDGRVAYRNLGAYVNGNGRVINLPCIPWRKCNTQGYDWNLVTTQISNSYNFDQCVISIGTVSPVSDELGRQFFEGLDPIDPDDPYPDDDSDDDDPDDPDGIPDPDPVPIPPLPDVDALDSGFITLFAPTKQQVRSLASYMWTGGFDLTTFKKLFADPMDCILGFNILPFSVSRGNLNTVTVGNIDTGVEMYEATAQYYEFDCGTLNIGKIYDTCLDFAPHCKWYIYLPFIGIQNLSTDDVAHKTLQLKYHIDILSCSCVAYLKCDDSVLYQFAGSCGTSIPITSENFARMFSSAISIAGTVGSLAASGGASAPMMVGAAASIGQNVMGLKPDIKRSGAIGASAGLMGIQKPYVIVEIPNICKPKKQHHYIGYPSFITKKVSELSGYAEFESVIVDGVPCTDEEREMIVDILKGGVYV